MNEALKLLINVAFLVFSAYMLRTIWKKRSEKGEWVWLIIYSALFLVYFIILYPTIRKLWS